MSRAFASLALLFFVSGAAALVVETTWLRWFRLLFGATAPAVSATLVAFFLGHALGAALGARFAPRWRRPLWAYAGLEAGAAAGALLVPLVLGAAPMLLRAAGGYDLLRESPGLLGAGRFALALGATLPTALCFGATLPTVGAAILRAPTDLGIRGSALYAINTFGAAVGLVLAAFWLPEAIGVPETYTVGIALSLVAACGALLLVRDAPDRPLPTTREDPETKALSLPPKLLGAALLSGFGSFGAQVLLVQAFGQVLNQSVYAFGAVLFVVLVSLALGAFGVAALRRGGLASAEAILGWALAVAALGFAAFPWALDRASDGLRYAGSGEPWPAYLFSALADVSLCAGPPLLAAALVLPATFALAERNGTGSPGTRLGWLAAFNTVGAIAGALVAPYVLLPALGVFGAFLALGVGYALAALLLPGPTGKGRWARDLFLAVGWVALLAAARPTAVSEIQLDEGETLLHHSRSAAGLVTVIERAGERLIRTDNHYILGGSAEIVHEERQGHLPLLLHADPRRVAFVGTATGISAGAALAHPVESLYLVELVPGVADAARRFFSAANRGVYEDPRSHVVLDDARNFLRLTSAEFDVVVADLFVPWRAGTGALFTQEHFSAVHERLAPGGLFCQWLPLYQLGEREFQIIAATFADVFPRAALFRGDFYGSFPIVALVGWRDAPASPERVEKALRRLAESGERDRWVRHPLGPWALYAGPLAAVDEFPRQSDARPRLEFLAGRGHVGGARGRPEALVGLRWSRREDDLREALRARGDWIYPNLSAAARLAQQGGAALQLAGGLYAAGRLEEASRMLTLAAERLPPELLAEAEPDASAAELWFDRPAADEGGGRPPR